MPSRVRMLVTVLAFSVLVTACNSSTPTKPPRPIASPNRVAGPRDIPRIQADAAHCATALFSGDLNGLLELTHPKLIEAAGGEESAREQWQKVIRHSKLISSNPNFETSFPTDPIFLQGEEHEFVIVPIRVEVRREGMRPTEGDFFQLAFGELASPLGIYRRVVAVDHDDVSGFPQRLRSPRSNL